MCLHCDYESLLSAAKLEATENRLRVLEVIGNNSYPFPPAIFSRPCSDPAPSTG